jgi:hypothetical protein
MKLDKDFLGKLGRVAVIAVVVAALGVDVVVAGEPVFAEYGAGARGGLDEPMKAKTVESLDLSFVIPNDFVDQILGPGAQTQVACNFQAKNGGQPQNGVKVRASGTVRVGGLGATNLGPVDGKTNSDGNYGATFNLGVPGPIGAPITVDATFDPSGNKRITNWYADCVALVDRSQ